MLRVAILDDYQNLATTLVDWSVLGTGAEVIAFDRHLETVEEAAFALADFDVIIVMRERMPVPRSLVERLPRLRLIITTGARNRSLNSAACRERGITACHTRNSGAIPPTLEIATALMFGASRNMFREDRAMRAGHWQTSLGRSLSGGVLGLVGFGTLGQGMARVAQAFGMTVVAWSENLSTERAASGGATLVSKDELFSGSDAISVHLVLSERTRNLIGAREFKLMKPDAVFVNTSRGQIVDEVALVEALRDGQIRAAGLDVFSHEPLPADHPLRKMENVVLSPHIGYATMEGMKIYFDDAIEAIMAWRSGAPIRVIVD